MIDRLLLSIYWVFLAYVHQDLISFFMAKLGFSAPADATQAVARTRDAVVSYLLFIIGLFSPLTYR